MITSTRTVGVVAAVLALLLGACSASGAPGNSPPATSPTTLPTSPAASAKPSLTQVPFDQTHGYPDGVTLQMSKITERKLGQFPQTEDPEAKEGDPYLSFTLLYKNGSKASVELTPYVVVRVGSNAEEAPRVYEGESRDALILAAGESTEYDVACLIPDADRSRVVIEIIDTPDPSRNIALIGSAN